MKSPKMYRWRVRMKGKELYKEGNPLEKLDEDFLRIKELVRK